MTSRKILAQLLETSIHDLHCEKCGSKAIARTRVKQHNPEMSQVNLWVGHGNSQHVCMSCGQVQSFADHDMRNDFPYPHEQEDGTIRVDEPEEPSTEWDHRP
jgi:DNA-directed RNA polymerase subunit RPC12/RpoP